MPTIESSVPLPGSPTTTTQTALDNSTKVSTTAYTDTAVGVETSRATTAEGLLLAKSDNLHSVADAGTSRLNISIPVLSPVAAVGTANVSLSAPGATFDGYSMQSNDEVLLTGQTTASQNGVWIWSGASSALVRPNEFATGAVIKRGRTVEVT